MSRLTTVLRYTLPTRYCDSEKLLDFASQNFGHLPHGIERVLGIINWLHRNIEYRTLSGGPNLSARQPEKVAICFCTAGPGSGLPGRKSCRT